VPTWEAAGGVIGRTIGHYEVKAKLGEGAMGEVYRAVDTRLKRDVALKMLSSRFANDPERVERLRREAEVLASLSHAHIGQIYGLEPAEGSLVLVLELVEGPTLADRLEKGPLHPEDALRIAHQIAAALEIAHERGIVHRDLKPSNVKLTAQGDVKVLDFGLAKGIQVTPDRAGLTADGAVIGTPTYMSPEQVAGRELDRRTDIWSFGCVLFEMLTGQRAFTADSIGSLFAKIATETADVSRLGDAPAPVRRLIERCLRRDPRTRLRDIGDARLELEEILAGRVDGPPQTAPAARRFPVIAVAALLLGGVLGALLAPRLAPETPPPRPARYSIALPPKPGILHLDSPSGYAPPIAISPDGQAVAFAAIDEEGKRQLYVRTAGDAQLHALPGTDGAEEPFFSPDGRYIGFTGFGSDDLSRISLADHSVRRLASVPIVRGVSWGRDGSMVFAQASDGLLRAAAPGAEAEPVARPGRDELYFCWPQILPDGEHVLFTAALRGQGLQPRILSLSTGKVSPLDVLGSWARYVDPGFLVYLRANVLWAVRIDVAQHRTLGDPVRILENVQVSELGNPHIAISESGVLVYEPGRPPSPGRSLVWVDRQGAQEPLLGKTMGFEYPRVSPDGRMIAFANHTDKAVHDICIVHLDRGADTQITNGGNYVEPVWSPDGRTLVFTDFAGFSLCTQALEGQPTARPLLDRFGWQFPLEWPEPGRLLFEEVLPGRGSDIQELNPDTGEVRPLIATVDSDEGATVSRDGAWLAYVSDKSGRREVYLCRYPDLGREQRVSLEGGREPAWGRDSRELFFRNGRGLFVVDLPEREGDPIGTPRFLFDGDFVEGFRARANYDVSADGQRFVMVAGGLGLTTNRLDVHLNFPQELEAALPREQVH